MPQTAAMQQHPKSVFKSHGYQVLLHIFPTTVPLCLLPLEEGLKKKKQLMENYSFYHQCEQGAKHIVELIALWSVRFEIVPSSSWDLKFSS